jgi:F-type H+-transporting ATPase subunit b
MQELLSQLGELIVGSIPTMVLFILLVVAYGYLVRRPLDRLLAERRARTSGAMEQARGAITAAEAETAAYEEKLRTARAAIAQAREQRLKAWAGERDTILAEARNAAGQRVSTARQQVEESAAKARKEIEDATETLSAQILQAILPGNSQPQEVVQ